MALLLFLLRQQSAVPGSRHSTFVFTTHCSRRSVKLLKCPLETQAASQPDRYNLHDHKQYKQYKRAHPPMQNAEHTPDWASANTMLPTASTSTIGERRRRKKGGHDSKPASPCIAPPFPPGTCLSARCSPPAAYTSKLQSSWKRAKSGIRQTAAPDHSLLLRWCSELAESPGLKLAFTRLLPAGKGVKKLTQVFICRCVCICTLDNQQLPNPK